MRFKLSLFFFLSLFHFYVFAQTGSLKGTVLDDKTGEAIIGATISVAGTTIAASADLDGNFELNKVPVGKHVLKVSFVGYATLELNEVSVYSGQSTILALKMFTDEKLLEEVTILAQRLSFSDISVISEIKQAEAITVGISAEQIAKTQDRDAAQVIRRVPGISIFDDRFVIVRGLNERYNTVMLNDALAPSTEVDTRAFSFDLIPSGAIDRMMVYKSPSADLPGDFSGGLIKIYTKTIPDRNGFKLGFQLGARQGTTFQAVTDYKGSVTDWLGFDNGLRKLPSDFPTTKTIRSNPSGQDVTSSFVNLNKFYDPKITNISPDLRLSGLWARKSKFGSADFTTYTSFNYSNTHNAFQVEPVVFKRYDADVFADVLPNDFQDMLYQNNIRIGLMSNWALILNPRNKIEFRNLFNQLSNKETVIRGGTTENIYDLKGHSFKFESRGIYSGQVSGKHDIGSKGELNWNSGFGYTKRKEPDTRRYITSRASENGEYLINVPTQSSPTLEQSSRFFSTLIEKVYMFSGSYEYKFLKNEEEENPVKLKVGIFSELKDRNFEARWFGYVNPFRVPTNVTPEEFFAPSRISSEGTYLDEGTNFDDKYTANNTNVSGYFNFTFPYKAFKLTTGLRTEYNDQSLSSFRRSSGNPVDVSLSNVDLLPSANTSYNFSEKSLLRASWGMTLNRPEFRELAPFTYYDFNLNASKTGNPDLINASVQNYDLRYEFYPSSSELISLGVFHKKFKNSIEQVIRYSGSGVNYSYANVDKANSSGVELELRKSLSSFFDAKVIRDLNVVLNASVIHSNVKSTSSGVSFGERRLQGQSPYIINAGLYYNNAKNGLQINAAYNIIGSRIVYVGDKNIENPDGLYPDQFELPRNVVDLTIIKKIKSHFEVTAGVQDLLNNAFRIYQDTNLNGKVDRKPVAGQDDLIQSYRRGAYYTLGVNYIF